MSDLRLLENRTLAESAARFKKMLRPPVPLPVRRAVRQKVADTQRAPTLRARLCASTAPVAYFAVWASTPAEERPW